MKPPAAHSESVVPAGQPEAAGPDPAAAEAASAQEGPAEPPKPSLFRLLISDWKGNVRAGFDLGSGNNDRTRLRTAFDINKSYWGHKTQIFSEYVIAQDNRGESENRLRSFVNQDWSVGDSKLSGVFLRVNGDTDRFQDYEYRVNVSSGAKYQFVKNDKTDIFGRIGGSARREFGSGDDDWVPEGFLQIEVKHRISDRQRIDGRVEYRPEIEQPSRYRVDARANWNIDVDPDNGLALQLSATNRYDARPSRRPERNDFDLSVNLVWSF